MARSVGIHLAPHLAHHSSESSFELIPLGANLTSSLHGADDERSLVYIHEYVHFIQAATSYFGANCMHTFFHSMSVLKKEIEACQGHLSKLDRAYIAERFAEIRGGLEDIKKTGILDGKESPIWAETELRGFQAIKTDKGWYPVLLRQIHNDEARVLVAPISISAIQESMAFAVERRLKPELTKRIYQATLSLDNWDFFDYAAVSETLLNIVPHWDETTIVWVTIVVCDVALDHYLPLYAFNNCMEYIKANYQVSEPNLDEYVEFHSNLCANCRIESAEIDRDLLIKELNRLVKRTGKDSTPLDRILANYLNLYIKAFEIRVHKPHAFIERLLFLDKISQSELQDFESIPFHTTPMGVFSCHNDDNLATAGLAIKCMQHFSYILLHDSSKALQTSPCPLHKQDNICDYEKGEYCTKFPWYAPVVNNESCIYRCATDALGLVVE